MRVEIGHIVDAGTDSVGRPYIIFRTELGAARYGVVTDPPTGKLVDLLGKRVRITCLGEAEEREGVRVIQKIDCISSLDLIEEDDG